MKIEKQGGAENLESERYQSNAAFWSVAVVAQVCFFVFAMPVPQHLEFYSFFYGVLVCFIAAITLAIAPFLALRRWEPRPLAPFQASYGLTMGDQQFGWRAVFWLTPGMAIGTFIGGQDIAIQTFYPFAGTVLGKSPISMLVWLPFLLLYYVAFEFFYRGLLMRACYLADRGGERWPDRVVWKWILIQAGFCFLIHIGKPNVELAASLPASILFGWLAWRSKSIWYGVVIHFAVGIANDLGALWHSGRLEWFT